MAPTVPWILVAVADFGIRHRIEAFLPPSRPVLFAGSIDGAQDILRHNPVTSVVADPSMLAALKLKSRTGIRVVVVLEGAEPPEKVLHAATAAVCLEDADARAALQRALDPPAVAADRPRPACGRLVGASPVMEQVFERIRQVAASDSNVLIQGETGTGKDLAAEAVHACSARSRKPFVVCDCATLPHELMESRLFGYRRGAYTGAYNDHGGYLEAANGGTMFLDDIDTLDTFRQAKLLRILQEKKFERLGSERVIRVDVRFIAATNRDLTEMLDSGALRRDLYYRLNVLPVHMPPLRKRGSDVKLLTDYFTARWSEKTGLRAKPLTAAVRRFMDDYPWPGNVRELVSTVERLNSLCDTALPSPRGYRNDLLPESAEPPFESMKRGRRKFELRLIWRALDKAGGNRTRAAAMLGIHRNTLLAKLTAARRTQSRGSQRRGD